MLAAPRTDPYVQSYRIRLLPKVRDARNAPPDRDAEPAGRDVLAGEAIETLPIEPVSLAPAQQGMPPSAADCAAEAVQSQQVGRNCMVRKIAIQDPLKPRTNNRHRFMPPLVELVADRGQRRSHTLLGRQSHDLELSFSVRPATMREPQEVDRLRSALPPLAPPFSRKTTELNQTRFVVATYYRDSSTGLDYVCPANLTDPSGLKPTETYCVWVFGSAKQSR